MISDTSASLSRAASHTQALPLSRRHIPVTGRLVIKRNGTSVKFDLNKITRAIALAAFEVNNPDVRNASRDDLLACFGLSPDDFITVAKTAERVQTALEGLYYRAGKHPTIEQVQNAVVGQIAADGLWEVATAYMAYRLHQADRRLTAYPASGMSDYIAQSKYARYNAKHGRRDIWSESVSRVEGMHRSHFITQLNDSLPDSFSHVAALAGRHIELLESMFAGKTLSEILKDCFSAVERKEVLPSMRSMQFAEACLSAHGRIFNCSFSNLDRLDFFKEFFYLLLCGCGCGFSVQKQHIALLPALPGRGLESELPVAHHIVADTIEGWADSLDALIKSFYEGTKAEFSFHQIRPQDLRRQGPGPPPP